MGGRLHACPTMLVRPILTGKGGCEPVLHLRTVLHLHTPVLRAGSASTRRQKRSSALAAASAPALLKPYRFIVALRGW